MKIALVHDWLTRMRGGERVLELLAELYPTADIFALVYREESVSPKIRGRGVRTSWLQRMPGARKWYRYYLPLLPLAAESLDLSEYDLVISSSSAVVKGVLTRPETLHVSYVHSPMRYIWDLAPHYFPPKKFTSRFLAPPLLAALRAWDVTSSQRVDRFVANSSFVASRIRKYYRRSSTVIHPPVDTQRFTGDSRRGDQYLMVSSLVANKGVEIAVEAFSALGRPLRIVGSGPLYKRLRRRAAPNVEFTGWISDEELTEEYLSCRAFVHAAVEDFGIAPLEAAAAGKPSIALSRGGVLDSIVPLGGDEPPTGVFFADPTSSSLEEAVGRFEREEDRFDVRTLRDHARGFDRSVTARRITTFVERALRVHGGERQASDDDRSSVKEVERAQ
jgi:glycosyltransferase involved in cell wall biosynthesis